MQPAIACRADAGVLRRVMVRRAPRSEPAAPSRMTTSRDSPGARTSCICRAPHGSRPLPVSPSRVSRCRAAGSPTSVPSEEGQAVGGIAGDRLAAREKRRPFGEGRIEPIPCEDRAVVGGVPRLHLTPISSRRAPRVHSTNAVRVSRRRRSESLRMRSTEILTAASSGMPSSNSL